MPYKIIVNNFEDIITACNSLTEESYNNKLKIIEENYEIAKKYATIDDRLISTINELIKNNE